MHRTGPIKPEMKPNYVQGLMHKQACKVLNDSLIPRWLEKAQKSHPSQLNLDDVLRMNYGHAHSVTKTIYRNIYASMKRECLMVCDCV